MGFVFRYLLLLLMFTSCVSARSQGFEGLYDLPLKIECNGKTHLSFGGFICSKDKSESSMMQFKIPPTRGVYRVMNCNRDLTRDETPDDFDTQIWRKGFWIFGRTVRKYAQTPKIEIPFDVLRRNGCPISITMFAEKAGSHQATVIVESDDRFENFAEYSCKGKGYLGFGTITEGSSGRGVAFCRGLVGSDFRLRYYAKEAAILNIAGSSCGIAENHKIQSGEVRDVLIPLRKGSCPLIFELILDEKRIYRSMALLIGESRKAYSIDTPFLVPDGDQRKVIVPLFTSMVSMEIYNKGKIIWRSGARKSSFTVNNSEFPKGSIGCITAYSEKKNSQQGACFDIHSVKELSYDFF